MIGDNLILHGKCDISLILIYSIIDLSNSVMSDDCEIILTQEQYASMRRKLEEKDELNNHLLQQYKKIVEELDVGLAQKKLVMEAY